MTDSIEHQVRQISADVFNLPLERVTRDTSPDHVENWDSIQHLNFVLALEQGFGIEIEPEDIDQMRTVGAAIDIVTRKRGPESAG
jgi:acyl carrier protein